MLTEVAAAGICFCAYLLGSIPFGIIIARLRHVDLRSVGSGNIGATNAARALGKGFGVLVLLLDAGKAFLPAYVCQRFLVREPLFAPLGSWLPAAAAGAAFVGHLYPIFAGFRGGKGVASAFGGFLALKPQAALLGFLVYAVAYAVSRISSVGSLLAVCSFPLFLYLTGGDSEAQRPLYALAGLLLVLIVLRHRDNIRRLIQHREQRV